MKTISLYPTIIALVLAIALTKEYLFIVSPFIALFFILTSISSIQKMLKPKFIVFLVIIVLIQAIIIGNKNASFYSIPYSPEYLLIGIAMAMRAIFVMIAFTTLSGIIKDFNYGNYLKKIHLDGILMLFENSQRIVPAIQKALPQKKTDFIFKPITTSAMVLAEILQCFENIDN